MRAHSELSASSANLEKTGAGASHSYDDKRLRTWAGHGSGALCNGCGTTIREQEIEYEIEMPEGSAVPTLHFHFSCYREWAKSR